MGTNNGNVGKKGRSGRKSVIKEMSVARRLQKAFLDGLDIKEADKIKKIMTNRKGKINLTDLALVRALNDNKLLLGLVKKVAPDLIKETSDTAKTNVHVYLPKNGRDNKD